MKRAGFQSEMLLLGLKLCKLRLLEKDKILKQDPLPASPVDALDAVVARSPVKVRVRPKHVADVFIFILMQTDSAEHLSRARIVAIMEMEAVPESGTSKHQTVMQTDGRRTLTKYLTFTSKAGAHLFWCYLVPNGQDARSTNWKLLINSTRAQICQAA